MKISYLVRTDAANQCSFVSPQASRKKFGIPSSIWENARPMPQSSAHRRVSTGNTFVQVSFRVKSEMADEAAGILIVGGAIGCDVAEMTRPNARPRSSVTLQAYFRKITTAQLRELKERIAGMLVDPRGRPRLDRLTDPGWSTAWQSRFKPFRVGRRFLIVPPWHRRSESRRLSIVIQPGRAFGTGHHPTTAAALRAIEDFLRAGKLKRALDVGTGSGILAIAMARAGVREIVAIDVDAVALENACENAAQNGVARSIRFSIVPIGSFRRRFDLITANILAPTLIEMAPKLIARLAPRGRLILGGILAREARDVLRAYVPALRCIDRATVRGWTTLVMAR